MRKQIEVPAIDMLHESGSMRNWSWVMDQYPRHTISNIPWSGFSYTPEASFSIAYAADAVLLKYYIRESQVRAVCTSPNDLVYKDSCVEFFISFNEGASYYNIEFNCLGTCYTGYGLAGKERSSLPEEMVRSIGYYAELQASETDKSLIEWSITIKVPLTLFTHDSVTSLKGTSARANFYKCGDESPSPHYLSWSNIASPEPDFHLPEFFGELRFV